MSTENSEAYFRDRVNVDSQTTVFWGLEKGGIKEDSRVLPQMNSWRIKTVIEIGLKGVEKFIFI